MTHLIKKLGLALTFGVFALTAQAHEYRYIGSNYAIQIGADNEPPATGKNNVDFFAFYRTVPGDINSEVGLSRAAGDKVEIAVLPVKFASENYNAAIVQFLFPLLSHFHETVIEDFPGYLSEDFNIPSTGAWGYIVTGEIKKKGKASKFFVEKFVCGAGSKDAEFGTLFECIQ